MSSNLNRQYVEHYNKGTIEVIDIIDDWGLGFYLGNVLKYILRAPHKGVTLADYEKALNYLIMHRTRPCNMEACIPRVYSVEDVCTAWNANRHVKNVLVFMTNMYSDEYEMRMRRQHYAYVTDKMIAEMNALIQEYKAEHGE